MLTRDQLLKVSKAYTDNQNIDDMLKQMSFFAVKNPEFPSYKIMKKKMFLRLNVLKSCEFSLNTDYLQKLNNIVALWGSTVTLPKDTTGFRDITHFIRKNQNVTQRRFMAHEKSKRTIKLFHLKKISQSIDSPPPSRESSPTRKKSFKEPDVNYYIDVNDFIFTKQPTFFSPDSVNESVVVKKSLNELDPEEILNFGKRKPNYKSRVDTWRYITHKHSPKRGVPIRIMPINHFVLNKKDIEVRELLLVEFMLKTPKFDSTNFDNENPVKNYTDRIFSLIPKIHFLADLKKISPHDDEFFHQEQNIAGSLKLAENEIIDSRPKFYIPSINKFLCHENRHMKKLLIKTSREHNLEHLTYSKFMVNCTTIAHQAEWSLLTAIGLKRDPLRHKESRELFFQNAINRTFMKFNCDTGITSSHLMQLSSKG